VVSPREQFLQELGELVARARAADPALPRELRDEFDRLLRVDGAPLDVVTGDEWHGILGTSPVMLELRRLIAKFGPAHAHVLITGESGSGKERVAQALHRTSDRRDRVFVAENCAAIPDTLLESVLFGHKKGSFTGAVKDHPGHFLAADGGTLFLDEIGEMRLPMQSKLLRVLQEGEVRAVGDSKVRKIDVRVLAATNQALEARVKAGTFREDLFFRLNVLRIEVPPLRSRGDDILVLARRFLAEGGERMHRKLVLSPAAAAVLRAARWPGNVRQLQNEMQRVAALCDGPEIGVADLSPDLRSSP
jgi:transcriptional regulator with PAS, ATPase and Fis domain